jgi:hypothetical protein
MSKLVVGGITVFVVALVGLWMLFVRAPPPAVVCDHIAEVAEHEAEREAVDPHTRDTLLEDIRSKCIQHKLDKIKLRGRIAYASYARCVMQSESLAEIDAC